MPPEFVTVKLPLGLETSPEILMPEFPVFSIVILPLPKFFTVPPIEVPPFEVMTILPSKLSKAFPDVILSALTRLLNNVVAASVPLKTSVLFPIPDTTSPLTLTCPPCKLTSPRAAILAPDCISISLPAFNTDVSNVLSV